MTRREFLVRASAAGAVPLVLSACAPAAPPASAPPAGGSTPRASGPYPTYIPLANGPKPDYHTDDPRFDDGFDNYPANPFKAVSEKPGSGGTVNILNRAYFPPPTPYDLNPTWQEINRQMNATMNINVVAGPDYQTKFATTMAGDDLPDIMHIYNGYALAPNLPAFFKSKCADLTPYLAGDAAKEYPYLAAIPTYAWKNSVSAIDGALYLIPIQRHLPTFPGFGGYFFANTDIWNREIGEGYVPKNADDLKRILVQLTRPQEGRWGIGNGAGAGVASEWGPFGLSTYAAMFGAPNNWQLESSGKLVRNRETEGYKAAVGYLRELMQAGVFPPDIATVQQTRPQHAQGRYAMAADGYGNSWIDLWRQGQQFNNRFHMLKPFPAADGGQPQAFLSHGYISMNVIKKSSPDRIKELLRIMNFLAAPFGSQEDLLLSYGVKDQDYKFDARGNPVPNGTEAIARAGYVPWRYIAQHPYVNYQADLPGFARASYDAQQMLMPIGVTDPTDGYYSATTWGKGQTADVHFQDGVLDIIAGRRQLSEYDDLVKAWATEAGDQVRKEYMESMAAAK